MAKIKAQREFHRTYRKNGWPKAVIVSEKNARCYTVLLDHKSFGSLRSALAYVRENMDRPIHTW